MLPLASVPELLWEKHRPGLICPWVQMAKVRAQIDRTAVTAVLPASAMWELVTLLAAIRGLRPRVTDTVARRFRPRAEHGSLTVRGREWTRSCAIHTRRSAFPDSAKALKYAERPQTGQNPPTPFIPRDFRPCFGAGKRATFRPSGG